MTNILDPEESNSLFGFLLKKLREARGLTQKQLAQELKIDWETIVKWERGDDFPSLSVRRQIAHALELSDQDEILLLTARKPQFPNDLSDEVLDDVLDSQDAQLSFGQMLQKLRAKQKMTQEQFVQKLRENHMKISLPTFKQWEAGYYFPDSQKITEIARICGYSARDTTLLLNAAFIPTKRVPPSFTPENPYKGLAPFTEMDQHKFFGRTALIQDMVSLFLDKRDDTDRFIAVTGPSGCGKTSVVQAGLLPFLKQDKTYKEWMYLDPIRPGSNPIAKLAAAFAERFQRKTADERDVHLEQPAQGLQNLVQELMQETGKQVVVTIDQGEELFTIANPERRTDFLNLLVSISTQQHGSVWIIFIFRSDFSSRFQEHHALAQLMKGHLCEVPPLDGDALREVIIKPAENRKVRLVFEDDLVNTILVEMRGQPGCLPLLQFTLALLFEHRAGNVITKGSYEALGGVRKALANHAQQVYDLLPSHEYQSLVQSLFLRLIAIDGEVSSPKRVARRRASLEEFVYATKQETARMEEVIKKFAEHRLLHLDETVGVRTVEVSHETLLQEWKLCLTLSQKHSEGIRIIGGINRDAMEWKRLAEKRREKGKARATSSRRFFRLPVSAKDALKDFRESQQRRRREEKPEDRLYRRSRLKAVKYWIKDRQLKLSADETLFIHTSGVKQLHITVVTWVFILLFIFSVAGGISVYQENHHDPTLVTSLQDSGVGSLSWAIAQAPSGSTITFSPSLVGHTILLTDNLDVQKRLTIQGPGASLLTIHDAMHDIQVNAGIALTISGLTLSGGKSNASALLINDGTLWLTKSIVSDNTNLQDESGIDSKGGGIYNSGTLILTDSTISGNTAKVYPAPSGEFLSIAAGGGIFNAENGKLTLIDSTISDNTVLSLSGDAGGGIFNDGTFTLVESTISGNEAISGDGGGGGIYNEAGTLNSIFASTIMDNTATSDAGVSSGDFNAGILRIGNSLIAENHADIAPDIGGSFTSNGYNLIQNASGVTIFNSKHMHSTDLLGIQLSDLHIDPKLQQNGGFTQTHALLLGSPAIDAIPLADCYITVNGTTITTDQRGKKRPHGSACDIGAYEYVS